MKKKKRKRGFRQRINDKDLEGEMHVCLSEGFQIKYELFLEVSYWLTHIKPENMKRRTDISWSLVLIDCVTNSPHYHHVKCKDNDIENMQTKEGEDDLEPQETETTRKTRN